MDRLLATKSEGAGLIVRAISFQDFQPMWSQITNVTDGQTDRQTTCDRKTALCTMHSASRGKKMSLEAWPEDKQRRCRSKWTDDTSSSNRKGCDNLTRANSLYLSCTGYSVVFSCVATRVLRVHKSGCGWRRAIKRSRTDTTKMSMKHWRHWRTEGSHEIAFASYWRPGKVPGRRWFATCPNFGELFWEQ